MVQSHSRPVLCLIDASSYFYRAYFAIRPLTTSTGIPVNAIYGFTTMLIKVLKDLQPQYVSLVYDSKEKTFRNKMYELYKANRSEMPEDLVQQIPYIKQIVEGFKIHTLEMSGYEADDLIGTVCVRLKQEPIDIVIVSSDKDLMQLVDDGVMIYDTMRDKKMRFNEVVEKFGVPPEKVIDVLSLMGDSSDNVPGAKGIGPKTASELIRTYGSLESVYENLDKIKGKVKEILTRDRKIVMISQKLVTLHCDVPVHFKLSDFEVQPLDKRLLSPLFHELEFKRLVGQLDLNSTEVLSAEVPSPIQRNYQSIQTEVDFVSLFKKIKGISHVVIDLETTSLDPHEAKIVGIALAFPQTKGHEACYIPIGHVEGNQLSERTVLSALTPLLESKKIAKWGQNIKYDALILLNHGIRVENITDDSMIASYLLNPAERHNLDAMALKYLNHKTIHYEDVAKKEGKKIGFQEVDIHKACEYAGEDADVTYRLIEILKERLLNENKVTLYETVEMPLLSILLDMEKKGVKVNIPYLKKLSKKLEDVAIEQQEAIYKSAGETFNIQSHQQLAKILFEKLNLPVKRRTKTGFSTDENVLLSLSEYHELPKCILAYREAMKLKSTYVDALMAWADPKTDRVHTSYNQTIAETGRLSSSQPNLQNIPIRSEWGAKIREAFIAGSGMLLLSADYSQVELRLLAHLSQDPALIDAFLLEKDIHLETAAEVFGVPPSIVTPEMRSLAKTINFGLIYGQSAFGLSRQLKISVKEASLYIEKYFSRYAKVKSYMAQVIEAAKKTGYVETMTSRRRYLEGLKSSSPQLRQVAERMAINTPIQGSAADLIKMAMISIAQKLHSQKRETKMILQVHDELVFEVPKKELAEVQEMVKYEMEHALKLSVPILVDIHTGKNWAEAHR